LPHCLAANRLDIYNRNKTEDLALTLIAKKLKIKSNDCIAAFENAKIDKKILENIFKKFGTAIPKWMKFIEKSFLNEKINKSNKELISQMHKEFSGGK
jgi:serine/threonine-protein kinase HipA